MQPQFSPHSPYDPAATAWAAVTLRVAWTLYAAGIRPGPAVLHEVRAHVMMCLPDEAGRLQAEELASYFTQDYIRRMQQGRYRRAPFPKFEVELRPSWRERLLDGLESVGEVFLQLHYGDGLELEGVARLTHADPSALVGAQEGIRSAMRVIMDEDGIGHSGLDNKGMDRLLVRVSQLPSADCQGGHEVAAPNGQGHAERCPRCARGVRMIRAGLLSPTELMVPPHPRPRDQMTLLSIHLHPDGRHHRRAVVRALGAAAIRTDDDVVLVDLDRIEDHVAVLQDLALDARPERDHIRGAVSRGAGRWTNAGIIGPVASAAIELSGSRSWGEVDGCGMLPEPLPEPPTAARWWMAATLAMLLAVLVGTFVLREGEAPPTYPVAASFDRVGDVVTARVDTNDLAHLTIVVDGDDGPRLLHASATPWDKGVLATGEGDYSLVTEGHQLLVASSEGPLQGLESVVSASAPLADPLANIADALKSLDPLVDVEVQAPPPSP